MEFWFGIGLAAVIGLLLGLLAGVALVQPRLKKVKRRWQESAAALSKLQAETAQLNKNIIQVQTELGTATMNVSSLTKEKDIAQKDKETAQNELATVRNSLNQISQEKERLFLDLVTLRSDHEKLRAELEGAAIAQSATQDT